MSVEHVAGYSAERAILPLARARPCIEGAMVLSNTQPEQKKVT